MERIFSYKLKNIFVYLALASILLIQVNSALYTHSHIDEYGQIICHAHPFDDSDDIPLPLSKNKHSNSTLYILSSVLLLFIVSTICIDFNNASTRGFYREIKDKIYFFDYIKHFQQRGPPRLL